MFDVLYFLFQRSSTVLSLVYLLCMGVCGGEGAEKAAGGGVQDVPSPSDVGPEPLRTEPSRSANFVVAEFRMEGREEHGRQCTWEHVDGMVAIKMKNKVCHTDVEGNTEQKSCLEMSDKQRRR